MSAWTLGNIAENSVEDLIDEGVSNLVYGIGNCYFGDKKSYDCKSLVEDSFSEALEGAGQTLKFSIMNAVIFRVTEYALSKLIIGGGLLYGYITGGKYIEKMKNKVSGALRGKKGLGALSTMLDSVNGTQQSRLKLAGMANDSLNSTTQIIATERQNAIIQVSKQREQLFKTLELNQNNKGLNDNKKIEAYYLKMKTGSWTINTDDKDLFLSVVPKRYITKPFNWNMTFIDKLNQFSEYAKTTENKLVNLAQTHLDLMTASNLSKVK